MKYEDQLQEIIDLLIDAKEIQNKTGVEFLNISTEYKPYTVKYDISVSVQKLVSNT